MKAEDRNDGSGVRVERIDRQGWVEVYVNGSVQRERPAAEVAGEQLAQVGALLSAEDIEIIQEKVFVTRDARDEVLEIRRQQYQAHGLDPSLPVTVVEQPPAHGGEYAGIQIWGVAGGSGGTLATVEHDGVRGRCWSTPGLRVLCLASVTGAQADGTLPTDVTQQGCQMYARAIAAVRALGFSFRQVARTWIYSARLLDWYGELNRLRTEHYGREGLTGGGTGAVFPASTGIQGRSLDTECFMDLLAIDATDSDAISVTPVLGSRRQPAAFSYGSSFSRGMTVATGGRRTVYVSGTASIDPAGKSVHVSDPHMQCVETLLNVAAILDEQGAGLHHIRQATFFFKTPAAFAAYQEVGRLLGLPDFPAVHVIADVCRDELLVELEAVAVV